MTKPEYDKVGIKKALGELVSAWQPAIASEAVVQARREAEAKVWAEVDAVFQLGAATTASPVQGAASAVELLAKRLTEMGAKKFSFTPGSNPNATPEQIAAEINKALDQIELGGAASSASGAKGAADPSALLTEDHRERIIGAVLGAFPSTVTSAPTARRMMAQLAWNTEQACIAALAECAQAQPVAGQAVTVRQSAIDWLKKYYPALCEKSGLCERVGGVLYTRTVCPATPAPEQEEAPLDPAFLADLARSRAKYPGNASMLDGLCGELHELKRAYSGDGDVRAEAFDVAVCAYRLAVEGDAGGNQKLDLIPDALAWGAAPVAPPGAQEVHQARKGEASDWFDVEADKLAFYAVNGYATRTLYTAPVPATTPAEPGLMSSGVTASTRAIEADVMRPFGAPAGQHGAGGRVLTDVRIVELAEAWAMTSHAYQSTPLNHCLDFARAIEAELASGSRAQGGNTNTISGTSSTAVDDQWAANTDKGR